jgi:hypothetical protein
MIKRPSLEILPIAYKNNRVYSPIPNEAHADQFSTISTASTKVNKDGYIETIGVNEPQIDWRNSYQIPYRNLLIDTVNFNGITFGAGVTASINTDDTTPLGNTVAEDKGLLLDISLSGTTNHQITQDLTEALTVGETYTASVWIKTSFTSPFQIAYYNSGSAVISDTLIPEGTGDWEKLTYTFTVPSGVVSTPNIRFNGSSNGADGDNYQLWGMQLEVGSNSTEYQPRGNYGYYYDNSVSDCPCLILEDERINTADYGQTFNNALWVESNLTKEYNKAIAPNGLNEATKITISGASTSSTLVNFGTIDLNSDAVVSLFVKKDTAQYILIDVQGVYGVTFDFLNEAVFPLGAVDNYGVEKYNDGWFRIWFYKASTGAGSQTYSIRFSDGVGVFGFSGGDSPIGKSAYIWGAQATIGTYPVNYIPNDTSGSVTKARANFSNGAMDFTKDYFDTSAGISVVLELAPSYINASGTSVVPLLVRNQTNTDYIGFGSSAGYWRNRIQIGGTAILDTHIQTEPTFSGTQKIYVGANQFGFYNGANGTNTDSGTNDCSVINNIENTSWYGFETTGQWRVKRFRVWNEKLPETTLQELTR